jgi:hypothetical protein
MFAKDNLNFYSQLYYKIMIIIPKLYPKKSENCSTFILLMCKAGIKVS